MYLIDGNNVIGGRVGWHKDKSGARRHLMEDVARLAAARKTRMAIVFDGAPDPSFPEGARYRGVRLHYARKGSDADARIIEMVEAERNRRNMVVVTSDGRLAARVRVCGVRVMRAGEFRNLLDQTLDDGSPNDPARPDGPLDEWMRYFGVVEDDEEDDEDME